jgi:hypothetical protein
MSWYPVVDPPVMLEVAGLLVVWMLAGDRTNEDKRAATNINLPTWLVTRRFARIGRPPHQLEWRLITPGQVVVANSDGWK